MSSQIDLSGVYMQLSAIQMAVGRTREDISTVSAQVASTDARLTELATMFDEWIEVDRRQKELQLAETRVVKVRQQLEKEFSHYGDVRRLMTGILQAVDAGLVTHEAIQSTSEDVMLRTPRYWLAPAVVAVAAWLRDDRVLSSRGLDEAMHRDLNKTAILMALVLRRYGRTDASIPWLQLYLTRQDVEDLPREAATLVDAAVCGAFGPGGKRALAEFTSSWFDHLDERPEAVDEQTTRWQTALRALTPTPDVTAYRQLPSLSPTWSALQASLAAGALNGAVAAYFDRLLNQPVTVPATLAERVDSILDALVTEFDVEELPLRRQEARLTAIIELEGDTKAADVRIQEYEGALDERVNLPQLFANIVMHPGLSGVDLATQKYAVAASRRLIIAGYDRLVAEGRAAVPTEVQLQIDGWTTSIRDGADSTALVASLAAHMDRLKTERVEGVKATIRKTVGGMMAAGFLGGALTKSVVFALFMFGLAAVAWFTSRNKAEEAEKAGEALKQVRIENLKTALAEIVDFSTEWQRLDEEATITRGMLESLTAAAYEVSFEPRTVLPLGGGSDQAGRES